MAEERNINPIPIHNPTDLGGLYDLTVITVNEIIGFRRWVAEYIKLLKNAHEHLGQSGYKTVNGYLCYEGLYEFQSHLNKEDPVSEFLYIIGFTEDDIQDLIDYNNQEGDQKISYIWKPTFKFDEQNFQFWIEYLQSELSIVSKIELVHQAVSYYENDVPDEANRVNIPFINLGYDIVGPDRYEYSKIDLEDMLEPVDGESYYKHKAQFVHEALDIKFYDSSNNEIQFEEHIAKAILAIVVISINEAITLVSSEKIGENEHGVIDKIYQIITKDTIEIDFHNITYDRYICAAIEDPSGCYYDEGTFGEVYFGEYYGKFFWEGATTVITPTDPVNNDIGMFEFDIDTERYYLRVDFEKFANPDEISYLISIFSYVDAYTDDGQDGFEKFVRGIIGVALFVVGAWLLVVTWSESLSSAIWSIASYVIGGTYRYLENKEIEKSMLEMAEAQKKELEQRQEAIQYEAFLKNKVELENMVLDAFDRISNPYDSGFFLPLQNDVERPDNPYYIGGEFWDPHMKLELQRKAI